MEIIIVKARINSGTLERIAAEGFGDMVKGVVDVKRRIMALGGELHADAEAVLLQDGSRQTDLWGFNIYIRKPKEERVEYSSLINIRPSTGSRFMEIKDMGLRAEIQKIIDLLVEF